MTEKRFITNDPYGYSRIFYDGSRLDNKKVCKKLNAFVEENEQLKQQNKMLRTNVGKLTDDVKYLRNLPTTHQKENKQLKKALERKQRRIDAYEDYIKTLKEDGVLDD